MSKKSVVIVTLFILATFLIGNSIIKNLQSKQSEILTDMSVCEIDPGIGQCASNLATIESDSLFIYSTLYYNSTDPATLNIKWIFVQGGVESIISQQQEDIYSKGFLTLKAQKPLPLDWEVGEYKIVVEIEDSQEQITAEFEIVE